MCAQASALLSDEPFGLLLALALVLQWAILSNQPLVLVLAQASALTSISLVVWVLVLEKTSVLLSGLALVPQWALASVLGLLLEWE
jgi:hypothetical protein